MRVVRFFTDPNVEHVSRKVDPQSDVETIKTELVLADMGTIEKALSRLEKEAKRDKSAVLKFETAKKVFEGSTKGTEHFLLIYPTTKKIPLRNCACLP